MKNLNGEIELVTIDWPISTLAATGKSDWPVEAVTVILYPELLNNF